MRTALLLRESAIQLEHRDAIPRPRTFDETNLTIDAVIASTTPVRRRDQRGEFLEVLDPTGLDLAVTRGASVLDSHRQTGIDNVLGAIDDVWIEGSEVVARLRFSSRPEIAPVITDIRSGIIRNLSVGYAVDEWKAGKDASGIRTMTAVRWSVREASFVAVPADPTARTRAGVTNVTGDDRAIRELGRRTGASTARVDALIELGASIEDARRAFLNDMLQRNVVVHSSRSEHNVITLDNPEVFVRAAGEALYQRIAPNATPSGPARQYIGMRIADLAGETLRRHGISTTGMTAETMITRALHSTSDFALILGDTVGRTLRAAYQSAPSGIRQLARETSAQDFRKKSRLQLDASGFTLTKVNETGEFTMGTMEESGESYAIDSYGRIFGISRKAMVNDDLGAFSDLSRRLGQAAGAFEAQFLVDLVVTGSGNGPTMSDGKALFHTDHGNKAASGAAPSETTLSAARLAMRKQTAKGGGLISVTPRFLLAPPDLETTCEKLLTAIQATNTDDVNPFARLSLVIEPRLANATRWYLVADASEIDGLEFAYLAGAPGPQVETRAGFEVDGVQVKVRLDFGAGFVDWRGWYANAGA
ncbi:Mu-like prophage major head subunit gpT family protein [Bradyrhizobium sp. BRP22]|uniref:phage major capsid protein n=1 Tax=Bradyrhizobium sp. BRP22 TaxID=2793821 RepID=UPI001CD5300D|nr:Mu-like prophage major head subunit gpT family protein [Bradyrhizobium sp. BRP22]MCA1453977.1 Mu-like prophage major head subunit gpT family protein [Bradyrhizobium sp. BRP22]